MTETKFTPGPWKYIGSGEVDATDDRPVAFAAAYRMGMDDAEGVMGEATANAHLIAAAPDLYAALKDILRIARAASLASGVTGNTERIARAEAALAKAEGR